MKIHAYLLDGRVLERDLPVDMPRLEVELPDDGGKRRVLRRTDDSYNGAVIYREVTP
jgi:hypothetical protein